MENPPISQSGGGFIVSWRVACSTPGGHVGRDGGGTRVAGFMGFWWQPQGMPDGDDSRLYLQLEWDRLCFKVGAARASRERRNELKWEWNEKITGQHERVIKPKVMRQGSTMTVAEHQDGWLRYDECGVLDLDASLDVLREAERTLLAAVGISYGRE